MQAVGLTHIALQQSHLRFGMQTGFLAAQKVIPRRDEPVSDRALCELFAPLGLLNALKRELTEAGAVADKSLTAEQAQKIRAVLPLLLRGGLTRTMITDELQGLIAANELTGMFKQLGTEKREGDVLSEVFAAAACPQSPMLFKKNTACPLYEVIAEWMLANMNRLSALGRLTADHLNPPRDHIPVYLERQYGIQVTSALINQAMVLVTLAGENFYSRFSQYQAQVGTTTGYVRKRKHHAKLRELYKVLRNQLRLGLLGDTGLAITVGFLRQRIGKDKINEVDCRILAKALELEGYLSHWQSMVGRIIVFLPRATDADSRLRMKYEEYIGLSERVAKSPEAIERLAVLRRDLEAAEVIFPAETDPAEAAVEALKNYIARELDEGRLKIGDKIPRGFGGTLQQLLPEVTVADLTQARWELAKPDKQILLPLGSQGFVIFSHPNGEKGDPVRQEHVLLENGFLTFPSAIRQLPPLAERALVQVLYQASRALTRGEANDASGWQLKLNQFDGFSTRLRDLCGKPASVLAVVFRFLNEQGVLDEDGSNGKALRFDPREIPLQDWVIVFRGWLAGQP